jgi:hypothetical protein
VAKNFSGRPMPAKASTLSPAQGMPVASGRMAPRITGTAPIALRQGPVAESEHEIGAGDAVGDRLAQGPAGTTRPLPKPVARSTTRSERSLARPGFWKPSSITTTAAPSATAARAAAARSRPT